MTRSTSVFHNLDLIPFVFCHTVKAPANTLPANKLLPVPTLALDSMQNEVGAIAFKPV